MPSELEIYKKYIADRISHTIPALEEAAVGNFSGTLEVPEEEDEFTELLVALNLMLDDLREFDRQQKGYAKELEAAKSDLEKRVEERTSELRERVKELEKMQSLIVGREFRIMELKREVQRLKEKCGEPVE